MVDTAVVNDGPADVNASWSTSSIYTLDDHADSSPQFVTSTTGGDPQVTLPADLEDGLVHRITFFDPVDGAAFQDRVVVVNRTRADLSDCPTTNRTTVNLFTPGVNAPVSNVVVPGDAVCLRLPSGVTLGDVNTIRLRFSDRPATFGVVDECVIEAITPSFEPVVAGNGEAETLAAVGVADVVLYTPTEIVAWGRVVVRGDCPTPRRQGDGCAGCDAGP